MWWHKKPSPNNLEEWLEIATKNIVPLEAEAIAREIKSHYQDELEFQMSYGKTKAEAENIALADLGNAYKANQKFCQSHITLQDSKLLELKNRTDFLWFLLFLSTIVFLVLSSENYPLVYIFFIRFIEGISKFIQSYFVSIKKSILGLKVTQRLNLLVFPSAACFVLYELFFETEKLSEWQVYFYFFALVFIICGFFEGIKNQNNMIQKFTRYFSENPEEPPVRK